VKELRCIQAACAENIRGDAISFPNQSQQQVFGADVFVLQPTSLLLG
jgi:hypothetical protein